MFRLRTSFLIAVAGTAAASLAATLHWTDLTEGDWLTSIAVRRSVVDGRTVHYPTPTKELAAALAERSTGTDATSVAALRHLAEARRELGDRAGAEKALASWAERSGEEAGSAWAEAARWGATQRDFSFAFRAAARAIEILAPGPKRVLLTERINWARAHPDLADSVGMLKARAEAFPSDPQFTEEWIRALEGEGRLAEAEHALVDARSLSEEKRLLVLADLKADHGDLVGAYAALEVYLADPEHPASETMLKSFATRSGASGSAKIQAWRTELEAAFSPRPLVLLERLFQGQGRGDLAFELLQQIALRWESGFDRGAWLLMSRLWDSIDAVPEAFRSRLAASHGGSAGEKRDDLAALAQLALRAGARPLAWSVSNDEPYRWAARIDVTPGFLTGGLSLLLTGFERESALKELEARRLPERTFETARHLIAELQKRTPDDARLPELTVSVMARHVERGEGEAALKLLPRTDRGTEEVRAEARRVALLAVRQSPVPLARESTLFRERLRLIAPDGSVPEMGGGAQEASPDQEGEETGEGAPSGEERVAVSRSLNAPSRKVDYGSLLQEAVARLDARDSTHRSSLTLVLGELDRLPKAESVWIYGVDQISRWDLKDGLESRYRLALDSFGGASWWKRLARWYVKNQKENELKALADDVVARFRSAAIFDRDPGTNATVPLSGQPNPYVLYGSYLRLKALERFPASPRVLKEAESHLILRSTYEAGTDKEKTSYAPRGIVDDGLMATRRNAVLYEDDETRNRFIDELASSRRLETFLLSLEQQAAKGPVENRLLLDGWTRLSQFERSLPFADRLAADYPGNPRIAADAMSLHRSLSALDPSQASAVDRIARAIAPTLPDAAAVWTALGETWQELDRPEAAAEAWNRIISESPRDSGRVLEVATTFWDYGRMKEALQTMERGRSLLKRPRMFAFESGVLKEETRDLPGSLDEYLSAVRGEDEKSFDAESRANSRLAHLMARPRVEAVLIARIDALKPGSAPDENALLPFLPLLSLSPEEPESYDDWIDRPNDPVSREMRKEARSDARPPEEKAIVRLGQHLRIKVLAMIPAATHPRFLQSVRGYQRGLLDSRWAPDPASAVDFENVLLAREAALAPSEEKRLEKEIARARFLAGKGRTQEAAQLWNVLLPRIQKLPDGATKIRDLVALARFEETTGADAVSRWASIGAAYPWSLGVLEGRLEFDFRNHRAPQALELLERASRKAAAGHREKLVERLAREALDHDDLPRAQNALNTLLTFPLDDARRVTTSALLTRISIRVSSAFDPTSIGNSEGPKLSEEMRANLWEALSQAARQEGALAKSLDLLIEALNRRTERLWLEDACRLAVRSNRGDHLLKFFDTQRKRSPRDVRWAIAVRQIKMFQGDLDGAIAAAKEAVLVAPEREILHRETVELLSRAGRFREAGEFLEGWARPRPSDESVATWRASLFVKAGDDARAIEVERAAIAAYRSESSEGASKVRAEAHERTARAARRFLALNRAEAAFTLAVPEGDFRRALSIPLTHSERTEIALRSGHFPKLLGAFEKDASFRTEAPAVLNRLARPEQLDELQTQLLSRIFPADGTRNVGALNRWWEFARDAGLARFSEAVARRLLTFPEYANSPYAKTTQVAFLSRLVPVKRAELVENGKKRTRWAFAEESFTAEWAAFLSERDRLTVLEPLLVPLAAEIDQRVKSGNVTGSELPFARWFPVDAFARIAALPAHAELRTQINGWFRTETAWRNFQVAVGERWDVRPLVALLDPETRAVWLAHGTRPVQTSLETPLESARRAATARVSTSLGALIEGREGALASNDIVRLRGPRRVGEVLGVDARFTWPEFRPQEGDAGDDLITGSGVDTLRVPGRLWGTRPGEAWFVLEALARLREKDENAPYVPLESAARGEEKLKTLLAVRTAEGLGEMPLALELDERYFADLSDRERLVRRLRLLKKNGAPERAAELFRQEIRNRQAKADADAFLLWRRIAVDLELPDPLEIMDPSTPLSSALLAVLYDLESPEVGARFRTKDISGFRVALAARWSPHLDRLSPAKTAILLDDIWAQGSARYPGVAARRLGPWWDVANEFLAGLEVRVRREGLAAVRALPDATLLKRLVMETQDHRDATEMLLLRAELAAGKDAEALARLDRMLLGTIVDGAPIRGSESPAENRKTSVVESEPDEGEIEPESSASIGEPVSDATRLTRWLRAFRSAERPTVVAAAETRLAAHVQKSLDLGNARVPIWSLALDLAKSGPERARVVGDLERSWVRGEWTPSDAEDLVFVLAKFDPASAEPWLVRLAETSTLPGTEKRARLLLRLKKLDAARKLWVESRARLPFTRAEEVQAFDGWRHTFDTHSPATDPNAPLAWKNALGFWNRKGSELESWGDALSIHLLLHPYDILSARVVLRSLSAAREAVVAPAAAALESFDEVPSFRIARSELRRSERAAHHFVQGKRGSAAELKQRRFPKSEIDGLFVDLARIGAKTADVPLLEHALEQLEERKAPGLKSLRAELGIVRTKSAPKPETFVGSGSRFAALRPRDLTWGLYARILNAEEIP